MDFKVINDEVNVGRHQICLVVGTDRSIGAGCVKRRRREPVAASGDDQMTQQKLTRTSGKSNVKRSSQFRGVSRHRWTGRYEAHLWDKLSWNVTQRKKGKQVYLGAYDDESAAARAFDLAAIKYWGTSTFTNFPISDHEEEIEIMQKMTKEEYLASLRRKSSGFSRGVSKYRGVARHHHNGRWEARIGRVFGNKYLYLGTYSTQEDAARAYDIAAIEYRGVHAVTNFDMSTYLRCLKPAGEKTTTGVYRTITEELQEFPSLTELSPTESQPFLFHGDSFDPDYLTLPQKQDGFRNTAPLRSYRKSSPTALGLLLRSSVFRELVEKNPNGAEEDAAEEHADNQSTNKTNGDVFGDIFYEGIEDNPFVCDTDGMELQEKVFIF